MQPFRKNLALLLFILTASAAVRAEDTAPISINDVIRTTPGNPHFPALRSSHPH